MWWKDLCWIYQRQATLWRNGDFMLIGTIVLIAAKINFLNQALEIGNCTLSFGRLRQSGLTCVPHVQHDYFSSFNQSDHCFLGSSLPLPQTPYCLLTYNSFLISTNGNSNYFRYNAQFTRLTSHQLFSCADRDDLDWFSLRLLKISNFVKPKTATDARKSLWLWEIF